MGLGIEPPTAERYANGLAHPNIGYTKVSDLNIDPLNDDDLKSAGVDVLKHRKLILREQGNPAFFPLLISHLPSLSPSPPVLSTFLFLCKGTQFDCYAYE